MINKRVNYPELTYPSATAGENESPHHFIHHSDLTRFWCFNPPTLTL